VAVMSVQALAPAPAPQAQVLLPAVPLYQELELLQFLLHLVLALLAPQLLIIPLLAVLLPQALLQVVQVPPRLVPEPEAELLPHQRQHVDDTWKTCQLEKS